MEDTYEMNHGTSFQGIVNYIMQMASDESSSALQKWAYTFMNTVPCPENMRGWAAVCVKAGEGAYPIGFGKAVAGTMKNHLPKGLYINR